MNVLSTATFPLSGRVIAVQANQLKPIEAGAVTADEARSANSNGADELVGDAYVTLGLPLVKKNKKNIDTIFDLLSCVLPYVPRAV